LLSEDFGIDLTVLEPGVVDPTPTQIVTELRFTEDPCDRPEEPGEQAIAACPWKPTTTVAIKALESKKLSFEIPDTPER